MNNYIGTLHVYSQNTTHDDSVIAGTKEALVGLRNAINQALEAGEGTSESFAADGEGFQCTVKLRESNYFQKVALPYIQSFEEFPGLDPRDPEADSL